ncbi:Hypothetical protein PP7435_CHR2-0002 [Komagataella phaffii CBS 7435]|uniref:Uncharacterized protein n=1 Tax=Komagataella phaffii (strain ATCC 76273 / CBS 7435 / CECT 11047 / NRRL Y-11430 / Wegner 21-1) TaxID=981350 RepID=F2QQM4_KOMPC|nr:Hypothetical protein BQ9382_C2-0008 [Komagataella phaffii CBS 7435]CCA37702.1 Hypothetical protein PP7435_CHR2-0002 [Komagataella phaffii CBS 7435]
MSPDYRMLLYTEDGRRHLGSIGKKRCTFDSLWVLADITTRPPKTTSTVKDALAGKGLNIILLDAEFSCKKKRSHNSTLFRAFTSHDNKSSCPSIWLDQAHYYPAFCLEEDRFEFLNARHPQICPPVGSQRGGRGPPDLSRSVPERSFETPTYYNVFQ